MIEAGVMDAAEIERVHQEVYAETDAAADVVAKEPRPKSEDVYRFTYAPSEVDAVYPGDYTGLPGA